MDPKRKKIQDLVLSVVSTIDPSGTNHERYKQKFETMSDNQFTKFMKAIESGDEQLYMYAPNLKNTITIDTLKAGAEIVKLPIQDHLWLTDPVSNTKYKTPQKYIILKLPVRRVKQFLMDKLSVPEGDTKTDLLSGQVVKPDKSSAISLIEMQTIANKGLDKSILEFIKVRGGDIHAYADFKAQLEETGKVDVSSIGTDSTPRSTVVAGVYLKAMHIDNNLVE